MAGRSSLFQKMADQYVKESISGLSRKEYLSFFLKFFSLAKENSKANARIAFLNADWRDFQGVSALEENPAQSICIDDYIGLLKRAGWEITHIIDAPLSLRAVGHPTISAKDGEPDTEKTGPWGRSPFTDYGKKMIGVGSARTVETMGTSRLVPVTSGEGLAKTTC